MAVQETKQEDTEILRKINHYRTLAEQSTEYIGRKAFRASAKRILKGRHHTNDTNDGVSSPSIQYVWLAIERMVPKIFNGYAFRPIVTPEAPINYAAELGTTIRDVLRMVPTDENDAVKEARLRTAILDRAWDIANVPAKLFEATRAAAWYGEQWLLDSIDENGVPTLDLLSGDDVWADREAKSLKESRFVGYRVNRTKNQLIRQFPEHRKQIEELSPTEPDKSFWLECWFIRDESVETQTQKLTIPIQEVRQYEGDGWVVQTKDDGFAVVTKTEEKEKYPGGWRHVKVLSSIVLEDGPSYSASGELPIHWLPFYKTPDEFSARSVLDQVFDLHIILDTFVGMAGKTAKSSKPRIIYKAGTTESGAIELDSMKDGVGILRVAADTPDNINEIMTIMPAPEISAGVQRMIDLAVSMINDITGSYDLRDPNTATDPISGEAVEQLESAAHARLSSIRAQVREVARKIAYNMMANVIAYMNDHIYVNVDGQLIRLNPTDLGVDEVERNFNVVVGTSDSLPTNGNKRNQALFHYAERLLTLPPPMARFVIKNLDLPFVDELEATMEQMWSAVPPKEDKGQQIFANAYAASLVNLAKDKDIPPEIRFRAIDQLRVLGEVAGVVPSLAPQGVELPPIPIQPPIQPSEQEETEAGEEEIPDPRVISAQVGTVDNPKRFM